MKKVTPAKLIYVVLLSLGLSLSVLPSLGPSAHAAVGDTCNPNQSSILGLPTWYKYLGGTEIEKLNIDGSSNGSETVCQPLIWTRPDEKLPKRDILLIAGAIMDMLTRIAGFAAFIYLMYGGFLYLTSSGNSENIKNAGTTLLNAAIGLAIAISATTLINYFATQISK